MSNLKVYCVVSATIKHDPVLVFQEGGPGSLPGPSVQGERTHRPLCGRGEHPHHASVLSDRPRRDERDHHEGKHTHSVNLALFIGMQITNCSGIKFETVSMHTVHNILV